MQEQELNQEKNLNPSRISLLPDEVVNQIKAGEVVERPLSIVKELVENALDAESAEVSVDLFDGGKSLIRVTDTGTGMNEQEASMAMKRHATSKIAQVSDLDELYTFGFRGEALASIASVSRFELRTRDKESQAGVSVQHAEEGRTVKKIALPVGTQIEVKDLFYNTPARQKFLKSTATEFAHIHDFLLAVAFAFPDKGISLTHNRRQVFKYRADANSDARAARIFKEEFENYLPVQFEKGRFSLSGFVSYPDFARSVPKHFLIFVNGRLVKDKVVRAGVLQAYSGLVMKGLVPSAVLFIQCDPGWVDVNAHPSKTEIRFRDPLVMQDLVCLALQSTLEESTQNRSYDLPEKKPVSSMNSAEGASQVRHSGGSGLATPVASSFKSQGSVQDGPAYQSKVFQATQKIDSPSTLGVGSGPSSIDNQNSRSFIESTPTKNTTTPLFGEEIVDEGLPSRVQIQQKRSGAFSSAVYLGQFAKCYLLIEKENQLLVVDQHAFHERILFEEYRERAESRKIPMQGLLTPHFIPVPISVGPLLQEASDVFEGLGFEIEWVEKMESIAVHSMPAFLQPKVLERVMDEVLVRVLGALDSTFENAHPLLSRATRQRESWIEEGRNFASIKSKDMYHLFYSTVACHSAVRSGESLSAQQCQFLLSRADDVDFSAHCPHGRPVMRRFEEKDVSQWFLRT